MKEDKKKLWFPAKKYGWGWGFPCAWQGWLVYLGFFAYGIGSAALMVPKHLAAWIVCVVIANMALLALCWAKGEKPRWRWGGD